MLQIQTLVLLISATLPSQTRIRRVSSHEEADVWHCDSGSGIRAEARFRPGIITVDGKVDDWSDVGGSEFPILPSLDRDTDKEYNAGKMTLKAVHDGRDAFFMLKVNGNYAYTQGYYFWNFGFPVLNCMCC